MEPIDKTIIDNTKSNTLCKYGQIINDIFYELVQYHNFLMRALVSNANLISERATNDREVLVGSIPIRIINNG